MPLSDAGRASGSIPRTPGVFRLSRGLTFLFHRVGFTFGNERKVPMLHDFGDLYRPCPCASGKKYKFCCLPEDRRKERETRAVPEAPLPSGLNPESVLRADLAEEEKARQRGLRLTDQRRGVRQVRERRSPRGGASGVGSG